MKKIIIVDDDESIRDSLQLVFLPSLYQLAFYPDARRLLSGDFEKPDIFIIDKQLPGIDGLDLCRHLKNSSRTMNIPVVILSANPSLKGLAGEAGADFCLAKPYRLKELREIVERYCGK